MSEQLFMDSFPVAEPIAQPVAEPVTQPVAQPITLQKVQRLELQLQKLQLQKLQPVGKNNESFKKRLFNRINQPYKPASEPTSKQAFEPASQQASESASLPALEAIASEGSVTSD